MLQGEGNRRQGLKGTLQANLWTRGVEVMGSPWEHVARRMPGT